MARCALGIGPKGGKTIRDDLIAKLDYSAMVDGLHENDKAS